MEKFLRVKDVADMLAIGQSIVWLYTKKSIQSSLSYGQRGLRRWN